jgi:hypothetical protein
MTQMNEEMDILLNRQEIKHKKRPKVEILERLNMLKSAFDKMYEKLE